MSKDRIEDLLIALGENPNRSAYELYKEVAIKRSRMHRFRDERGKSSEVVGQFLVREIPQVVRTEKVNQQIHGLDCDFRTLFVDIVPVLVQLKTSSMYAKEFLNKMKLISPKLIKDDRWVVLCMEMSFSEIKLDFINQVNTLDHKRSLTA